MVFKRCMTKDRSMCARQRPFVLWQPLTR